MGEVENRCWGENNYAKTLVYLCKASGDPRALIF